MSDDWKAGGFDEHPPLSWQEIAVELGRQGAELRQTLTEAEASHQADVAALTAERDRLAATLAETRQKLLDVLNAFEAERATLTAERDNARHGRNETDQWADVLRQQLHDADTERDRLRHERDGALRAHAAALIESRIWERRTERAEAERDTLAAQLARAETVVKAVGPLVDWITEVGDMRCSAGEVMESHVRRIVDAYQAPGETP